MKLQSQVSRRVGDKEYKKFWIVIPQKIIKKLGFKAGDELKADVKGDKLIIERDLEKVKDEKRKEIDK